MSKFECLVLEMPKFGKHSGADSLSICQIMGTPVIFKTGQFAIGDKVVYIPEDSLLPTSDERFSFLTDNLNKTHVRLKPKKLRGIYSEGLLIHAERGWELGQDVSEILGIKKHEDFINQKLIMGDNKKDPGFMPVYDVENYLKYKQALDADEEIVVTTKLHGTNMRCGWNNDEYFVGSHNCVKKESEFNLYWKVAKQYDLKEKLKNDSGIVLYGEVYGWVQDLHYGAKQGEYYFAAFDVYDSKNKRYLDYADFKEFCKKRDIPTVPELYRGPFNEETVDLLKDAVETYADGTSHVREGIVMRPVKEKVYHSCGRVIFKWVSQDYKLRKNGTEAH